MDEKAIHCFFSDMQLRNKAFLREEGVIAGQ
jgi:hypothetical protein